MLDRFMVGRLIDLWLAEDIGACDLTCQVMLDAVSVGASARGSFDLQFGADTLRGTFDAAYCPGGHEP